MNNLNQPFMNQGTWINGPFRTTNTININPYTSYSLPTTGEMLLIELRDFIFNNLSKDLDLSKLNYIKLLAESKDECNVNLAEEIFKLYKDELDRK